MEDKRWVEENIYWFVEVFGLERIRKQAFILPNEKNFPYDNLKDAVQFQNLFTQLCELWGLNQYDILVRFFDDIKSKQWSTWMPQGQINEPAGLYYQIYSAEEKRFNIQLAKSNLENPQLLISVIAHELAHVKLLGGKYVNANDTDMEPLTDLACIYFGFGVFFANSCQSQNQNWISRSGYLPDQVISYTNALICYISQFDASHIVPFLNSNTKEMFIKDYEFLNKTSDTSLTKDKVLKGELIFTISKKITSAFADKNFETVIEACYKLLELKPENIEAFNNIGYALLQQKRYREAIEYFTKSIDIDPFWGYPYNNRGYCKLQLGDSENAFSDIHSSINMDPENSFTLRNLGAFYLHINEPDKALQYFEEAEKIEPATELINFYLGHAHLKLGHDKQGREYLKKSLALQEHNDSMMPI